MRDGRNLGTGLFRDTVMGRNDIDTTLDFNGWTDLATADNLRPIGECRLYVPNGTAAPGKPQTFRPCDGMMFADLPVEIDSFGQSEDGSPVMWLEATCQLCGGTVASPNRRMLRRSSAHSSMPHGYWVDRMRRIKPTDGPE